MTLPRFSPGMKLVDDKGVATPLFRDWIVQFSDAVQQADDSLQTQIEDITRVLRSLSYPSGATVEAAAAGATATVSVTDHTRTYLDRTLTVTGGTVSGLPYGVQHFIYYDDPDNVGGAVTYQATTVQADALTSATNPNRHFVAASLTPATSGDPPVAGNPSTGAGGVEIA